VRHRVDALRPRDGHREEPRQRQAARLDRRRSLGPEKRGGEVEVGQGRADLVQLQHVREDDAGGAEPPILGDAKGRGGEGGRDVRVAGVGRGQELEPDLRRLAFVVDRVVRETHGRVRHDPRGGAVGAHQDLEGFEALPGRMGGRHSRGAKRLGDLAAHDPAEVGQPLGRHGSPQGPVTSTRALRFFLLVIGSSIATARVAPCPRSAPRRRRERPPGVDQGVRSHCDAAVRCVNGSATPRDAR
jgi:hypothetical protein